MRFIAALIVGLLLAPHARADEPSARRVYLLCESEDPQCGPALRNALYAFLANPTFTECYVRNFGGIYDPAQRCWRQTTTCHYHKAPDLNFDLFYFNFMMTVREFGMWQYPAHLAVWKTMQIMRRCG